MNSGEFAGHEEDAVEVISGIRWAFSEAEVEVKTMGCGHSLWRGIEDEAGFSRVEGAFDDRFDEGAAEACAAGCGANPKALDFPGIFDHLQL